MLEIDDSQEFIWELIDEIFDNTIKIIYSDYIEKKTIPYTINEAKKAIIHIIDVHFSV
jgi:ribosomal protein S6